MHEREQVRGVFQLRDETIGSTTPIGAKGGCKKPKNILSVEVMEASSFCVIQKSERTSAHFISYNVEAFNH